MNRIVNSFLTAFPKAWAKPGKEFDGGPAVIWSGEGSELTVKEFGEEFEIPAFDYYAMTKSYEFGVHKKLVAWADKHNLHWEAYDAGTYLAYRN